VARLGATLLATGLLGTLGVAVAVTSTSAEGDPTTVTVTTTTTVPDRYQGRPTRWWAHRAVRARQEANARAHTIRRLRRVLLEDPHVVEAINLACATYGWCSTLWRKASCETGGTFNPRALNSSSGAAGLFQFLASTWNTTPYRVFDRDSPYANALAAGWMHDHGRGGEWACR